MSTPEPRTWRVVINCPVPGTGGFLSKVMTAKEAQPFIQFGKVDSWVAGFNGVRYTHIVIRPECMAEALRALNAGRWFEND